MTDSLYHELILDLNRHPLNKFNPPADCLRQRETNALCGDDIELYLKIAGEKITLSGWQGESCALSAASASLLTEYLKGKTVNEIKNFSENELLQLLQLENLNPARLPCVLLPLRALHKLLTT